MSCCGNQWPSAQPQTARQRAATAAPCVYRAVRTAAVNTVQVNFSVQAVRPWPAGARRTARTCESCRSIGDSSERVPKDCI